MRVSNTFTGKPSGMVLCGLILCVFTCLFASPQAIAADGSRLALNTHVLAVDSSGQVYGWGFNSSYQVGDGTNSMRKLPVALFLNNVQAVAAGVRHSVALQKDGTLVAWGDGSLGQLGNGDEVNSPTPVEVLNLTNVVDIASGDGSDHTLALRADGTVWSWGDNTYGQLGNGTNVKSPTPVQVTGLTNVISIAVGEDYSLALKNDGTVWAWGSNNYSRLGQGDALNRNTPAQVRSFSGQLTNIVSIAAGSYHCLALDANGGLWGWGDNHQYELGNATTGLATVASVAMPITTISGLTKIAAGYQFSMGMKSDGTVWAWGSDEYGKLGDGTDNDEANILNPVLVQGVLSPAVLVAGGPTAAVVMPDGTVRMWGYGYEGQLGVNGTDSASSYVVARTPDGSAELYLTQQFKCTVPALLVLEF